MEASRRATLGLVPQSVVHKYQGCHGLYNRHRAWQHAGVMPTPTLQRGVLEIGIHRVLLVHDGGDRFEGDPEEDGLPIRDAALDASGTVGGGIDLAAFRPKRVVVLRAGEQNAAEAGANI